MTRPAVIHFVDVGRIADELRPVCGAWGEEIVWTTIRHLASCRACARRTGRSSVEPAAQPRADLPSAPDGGWH